MKLIVSSLLGCMLVSHTFADAGSSNDTCHAINPLARFGVKGSENLYFTGEAIWFKPAQMQLTSQRQITSSPFVIKESYFEQKFAPGFRVSVGYNTPYNGWDLNVIYTRLEYKHNNHQDFSVPVELRSASEAPGTVTLKYNYNQGDLDMGRMFRVSRKLKIRPHFGIRALWLHQKREYNTVYGSYNYYSSDKTKNTLVGLLAGADIHFCLSKEFTLYALAGGSTLVNSAKRSFANYQNSIETTTVSDGYKSRVIANLDLTMGLRWDRNFSDDRFHLGINLGWEQHNFVNINQRTPSPSNPNAFVYDFAWQGIALGARFDF